MNELTGSRSREPAIKATRVKTTVAVCDATRAANGRPNTPVVSDMQRATPVTTINTPAAMLRSTPKVRRSYCRSCGGWTGRARRAMRRQAHEANGKAPNTTAPTTSWLNRSRNILTADDSTKKPHTHMKAWRTPRRA